MALAATHTPSSKLNRWERVCRFNNPWARAPLAPTITASGRLNCRILSRITGTFAESGGLAAPEILGWSQLHAAAMQTYSRNSLGCGQDQIIAEEMSWSNPR